MRIFILFFAFFALLPESFAVIKIINITGHSSTNFDPNIANTTVEIRGGFAGPDCPGGTSDLSTCDNCTANPELCNRKRAFPNLKLQITFTSSTQFGTPKMCFQDGGACNPISLTTPIPVTTAANQNVTISVLWTTLCGNMRDSNDASDPTCQMVNGRGTFQFGFEGDLITVTMVAHKPDEVTNGVLDKNGNTACGTAFSFFLFPGDEKAFVEQLKVEGSPGGLPINKMQFYCTQSANTADVKFNLFCTDEGVQVTNGQMVENSLDGLSNGATYAFKAAVEDTAGNIMCFSEEPEVVGCPTGLPTGVNCRTVIPDEVIGLFRDKTACFVATAAYGSPMEKQVATLRQFRSQFLLKSFWGRIFVKTYYKYSPLMARWISESPVRRQVARAVLAPAVGIAWLAVHWSWPFSLVLLFGCGLFVFRRHLKQT